MVFNQKETKKLPPRLLGIFFAVALLSGCATNWYSANFPDEQSKKKQLTIDDGYCAEVAHGAAPMPAIRDYQAPSQPREIQGQITTFNINSGYSTHNYSGTIQPMSGGFAQGMAEGLNNGMAIGGALATAIARKRIYNSCMIRLGWSETPVEAEQNYNKPGTESKNQSAEDIIHQIPRLAYLREVSPESFNLIADIDIEIRSKPEWNGVPLKDRFEYATRKYEQNHGIIHQPTEPAPYDSKLIKNKQEYLNGYQKTYEMAIQKRDFKTAALAEQQIQRLKSEIWQLRQQGIADRKELLEKL